MNKLLKDWKICTFTVIFQQKNSMESFWTFFSVNNIRPEDQRNLSKLSFLWTILDQKINFYKYIFLKTLIFKVFCFLKMWPILVGSVHNFCRSYDGMIIVKKCLFWLYAYMFWCPTWSKKSWTVSKEILFIIKVQSWLPDCPLIFSCWNDF